MSHKVEPKIVLNDRFIGAGTDPSRGLPVLHLDSLTALGIEAPDQRYYIEPETARKVGVQLVLAADSDLASMLVVLTAGREATAAAKQGDWDGVAKAGEQLRDDLQALQLRQEVARRARFFTNGHEPVRLVEIPAESVVLPTDHLSVEQVEGLVQQWNRMRENPPVGPICVAKTERDAYHYLLRQGVQLLADSGSPLAREWLENAQQMLAVEGT